VDNTIEKTYVNALSKGDQKAFEVLFLHYYPKLVFFIAGFVKDAELARDMAQDVFLSIWKDKEKFSKIDSFGSYIFKMAKNVVCNYFDHVVVDEKYVTEQLARPYEFGSSEEIVFARSYRI